MIKLNKNFSKNVKQERKILRIPLLIGFSIWMYLFIFPYYSKFFDKSKEAAPQQNMTQTNSTEKTKYNPYNNLTEKELQYKLSIINSQIKTLSREIIPLLSQELQNPNLLPKEKERVQHEFETQNRHLSSLTQKKVLLSKILQKPVEPPQQENKITDSTPKKN